MLGEQGRFPEEHLVLKNAMTRDPLNELLIVNYASNLSIRGEWASGKALMKDLLELYPDSSMLLRSLAKMALMNGDLVEGWKLAYRAYQLEPDNPEEISTLARTWVMLGNTDEAERLILKGLESSGQNSNLLGAYWMTLMVAQRYEEAESLVRDLKQQMGAGIPASLERNFNFQLGLITLLRRDFHEARLLLMAAIDDGDQALYSGDDITALMLASLASAKLGDDEEAQGLLASAERRIQRGRLNGVDDSGIYYSEAVLLAMRSEPARALQKLEEAYEHGFREHWVMDIDGRLGSLRDQPAFISLTERIQDDLERARVEIESLSLAGF